MYTEPSATNITREPVHNASRRSRDDNIDNTLYEVAIAMASALAMTVILLSLQHERLIGEWATRRLYM